jgi:hypothetical protein
MLTELYEKWRNGQLDDSYRITYTYDVRSNMLSDLFEYWSNGQWVNSVRETYTYDAQENLTSLWYYRWRNSSWVPSDIGSREPVSYTIIDSAGNYYEYYGYSFTLTRKLIVTRVEFQNGVVPAVYSLSQNYPNPFNPSTTIQFTIPVGTYGRTSLRVYDVLGREVATLVNEVKQPGTYTVTWDGSGLASGVYLYRLHAGSFVDVKKMLLVR